jgi:hypothetical protein
MNVTIEAGAEIDIVTPKELRRELQRYFDSKPIRKRLIGSAVVPTPTAKTIVDLGGPPQGYRMECRLIVVSDIDPFTAGAGTAAAFIGFPEAIVGTSNAFDPLEAIAFFAAVPGQATFAKDTAVVQGTEHLYVVFAGATQAHTVNANAMCFLEPLRTEETYTA